MMMMMMMMMKESSPTNIDANNNIKYELLVRETLLHCTSRTSDVQAYLQNFVKIKNS